MPWWLGNIRFYRDILLFPITSYLLGSSELQKVTSHPVHIIDADGNLSPTSLIPFCSINDNYSEMGVKIDQIDVPVCNSFRPKIRKDQLCYTVDLNEIKTKTGSKYKVFFAFLLIWMRIGNFLLRNMWRKRKILNSPTVQHVKL